MDCQNRCQECPILSRLADIEYNEYLRTTLRDIAFSAFKSSFGDIYSTRDIYELGRKTREYVDSLIKEKKANRVRELASELSPTKGWYKPNEPA